MSTNIIKCFILCFDKIWKEATYCMEHWVLHVNNESLNSTSKNNDVLYGD